MAQWLVDDTGSVWPASSPVLARRLGFGTRAEHDRTGFVVVNLGFIGIGAVSHGLVVSWRPSLVQRETLAAAILSLGGHTDQRVVVRSLTRSWSDRLLPSVDAAVEALLDEFASPAVVDGSHFASRHLGARDLRSASPIRRALDAALASGLRFDPASLWSMLDATVAGRYLLLDPDHEQRHLRIMAVGTGYATVSRRWLSSAPGSHFEDQADRTYARAAARAFWAAADRGEHTIENVTASVWWPSRGRTALRYTRLVLPVEVAGKRRILCTSEIADP